MSSLLTKGWGFICETPISLSVRQGILTCKTVPMMGRLSVSPGTGGDH